jgi:hypothetical protein
MTPVSSANILGSDEVLTAGESSFMYIMKMKVPRINPWETPFFIFPRLRKHLESY